MCRVYSHSVVHIRLCQAELDIFYYFLLPWIFNINKMMQDEPERTGKETTEAWPHGTVCDTQALHDLKQFNISQFQTDAI
jgi:hypothetical protein